MRMEYQEFLEEKRQTVQAHGFRVEPEEINPMLFLFQRELTLWALLKGRAGEFVDCGLGKSPMELTWADHVARRTNGRVLLLTPLAVGAQMEQEAVKFNVEAHRSGDGQPKPHITITNYERLHLFNPDDYTGVVCDESSAIKAFDGVRRALVTEFLRTIPYRLLGTATAAPNDYVELGTSSEALGELGHIDMLNRFFKNEKNNSSLGRGFHGAANEWRFKPHAEQAFWRWVCSWARACRRPSDIGFDDGPFILPPLIEQETVVAARTPKAGQLFDMVAVGFHEQREVTRRTIRERCEAAATKCLEHDISAVWCHLNDEGDMLEQLIPHSIQVKGSDSDEWKEAAAEWFTGTRCICNDNIFRAKIATWQRDEMATGVTTIEHIANSGRLNLSVSKKSTPANGRNTCSNTTEITQTNGNLHLSSEKSGGARHESVMPTTLNTEPPESKRPRNTANVSLELDLQEDSHSLALPLMTMIDSQHKAALSVEPQILEAKGASTSTIPTQAASSEDCFAPIATLDSATSKTIQTFLEEQRCICGHKSGIRRLISKPRIFGWGLNFQACAHVVYFPSHSYEQYYQAVRRCWRFGQTRPVVVDIVRTDGDAAVLANLQRKAEAADKMFSDLVAHMNEATGVARSRIYEKGVEVPAWL